MQLEHNALVARPGDLFCELPVAAPLKPSSPRLRAILSLKTASNLKLDQPANRQAFFKAVGLAPGRVYGLKQVHGHVVYTVEGTEACRNTLGEGAFERGTFREGDGFITADKQAILAVTAADCLPILLFDRAKEVFGLVHSGWQGTGIVVKAVVKMQATWGTEVSHVSATIGPGIGPCCYNVPRERYDRFKADFGETAVLQKGEQYFLDLKAANIALLQSLGVQQVKVMDDCTFCHPLLSSFRQDGKENLSVMLACVGYF